MTIEYRLFGPPGTGKTTQLGVQARKWAQDYGSDQVALASFTRAAAAEIASRELPLARPREQIGTLHSFAFRALDCSRDRIAESHVDEFNAEAPWFRVSADERRAEPEDGPLEQHIGKSPGDVLLNRMEIARARRLPVEVWPADVQEFRHAWEGWKRAHEYLDFTDLIEIALADTVAMPGLPAVACFDEVQDFTPLELALVRHWSRQMEEFVLAGDDDQCIYGFKGAMPDAFLSPPVPPEHKRVLGRSYRLPQAVYGVVTAWITRLGAREPKVFAPRDEAGAVSHLLYASTKHPEPAIHDALGHLDAGRTVMMLTTCSFMLDTIVKVLREEGIPFHNPYRRRRGDWNPLAPGSARRTTARDRVLAFLRPRPDVWAQDASWYRGRDLAAWFDGLRSDGLLSRGAKARVTAMDRVALVDVEAFDELWAEEHLAAAVSATMHGDLDWLRAHLLPSKAKPYEFPLRVAMQRGPSTLRTEPKLVIGTIHSVKGGEADVVYLFPDLPKPAFLQWTSEVEADHDAIVRQFYVGMSRAREELVICGMAANPLGIEPSELIG